MASFFDLVASLQSSIDDLDQVLSGDENETVNINGVSKDTISKAVKDKLVSFKMGQRYGLIVFSTKAELDAYTPPLEQQTASFKVTNDPNNNLNGYYSWVSGSSYTMDASLVMNNVDVNNNSDAVSGSAVFKDVQEKIRAVYTPTTDNLMTHKSQTPGFYEVGGTVGTSPTWDKTSLIPVLSDTEYKYIGYLTSARTIAIFDQNGEWVADAKTTTAPVTGLTFTTPPNAAFVGVSMAHSHPVQSLTPTIAFVANELASKLDITAANNEVALLKSDLLRIEKRADVSGDYTLYQVKVKNPTNTNTTDHIVKVNCSFLSGDVRGENCIVLTQYKTRTVPDTSNTDTVEMFDYSPAIACQWLGDLNENLKIKNRNDGYWADSSLKSGKLCFISDFAAKEEKFFYLKVYQGAMTSFPEKVISVDATEDGLGQYVIATDPTGNEFKMHIDNSLLPFQMYINGKTTLSTRRLFDAALVDSLGATISIAGNSPVNANSYLSSSMAFLGSGALFKEIKVVISLAEYPQIEFTWRYRVWLTGQLDITQETFFKSDNDSSPDLILDAIYNNLAVGFDSAADTLNAVNANLNYITEGHHRFSINIPGTGSACAVLKGQQTQSRVGSPQMSDGTSCGVVGVNSVWLVGGVDTLKSKNQIAGTYTSTSIGAKFSGGYDNIVIDRYHYTEKQIELLNSAYGNASKDKLARVKSKLIESATSILNAMGVSLSNPASNIGSFGQHQLAAIMLGQKTFSIEDVWASYEGMKNEFKNINGRLIDYFESYFGISLTDAIAADNGSTYYPPFNTSDFDRPFATQKLGRDFHLCNMLISYYKKDNSNYQSMIADIDLLLVSTGISAELAASENLQKEKHNHFITKNNIKINELTLEIKQLADACILIVKYSNRRTLEEYTSGEVEQSDFKPSGQIWLQWKSSSLAAFNASTTIQRFLKQAMNLMPNDPNYSLWSGAYNEVRDYTVNSTLGRTNISSYTNRRAISVRNIFHYTMYTLYDFLHCEINPDEFDTQSFLYDTMLGSGIPQERMITSNLNRRGGINTYLYMVSILLHDKTVGSKNLALKLLQYIENKCFADAGLTSREMVFNDWENNQTLEQKYTDITASGTLADIITRLLH